MSTLSPSNTLRGEDLTETCYSDTNGSWRLAQQVIVSGLSETVLLGQIKCTWEVYGVNASSAYTRLFINSTENVGGITTPYNSGGYIPREQNFVIPAGWHPYISNGNIIQLFQYINSGTQCSRNFRIFYDETPSDISSSPLTVSTT